MGLVFADLTNYQLIYLNEKIDFLWFAVWKLVSVGKQNNISFYFVFTKILVFQIQKKIFFFKFKNYFCLIIINLTNQSDKLVRRPKNEFWGFFIRSCHGMRVKCNGQLFVFLLFVKKRITLFLTLHRESREWMKINISFWKY